MQKALLTAALTLPVCGSALAEVRINGFANLIGGITSSDDMLYGYDDNISFSEESLFALQASGDVNENMTATVQLVARGVEDYDVDFEWAYMTYSATENLSVSAGRFRLPLFRYSASLDVGYSFHWVTAPRNIYDVPFNNLDGIRLDYADFVGDWEYNVQLAVGNFDNEVIGGELEGDNTYVLSAEATYDWFKVRGVVGASKTTLEQDELNAAFDQVGSVSPALSNLLRMEDDTARFMGFGVEVDQFDWFVSGEYTAIEIEDSYTPKDTAWYVTAGLRYGQWTPSLTYESFDSDEPAKGLDILGQLPAEAQSQLLPAVVGVQRQFVEKYNVVTATVRYDFDTNVALKADISRYTDDINDNNDSTLMRFAINYVF